MNKKTTLSISAVALASILLVSGFGLSSVSAQTSSQTSIKAKVPSTLENQYSVIFQVCAGSTIMRAPQVVMSSDSEVRDVKLNKTIAPNACKTTATVIKALDPNTIKVKKVDKSKINIMITAAEKNLVKIKKEISATNDELETITLPGNTPLTNDAMKKLNDITSKLVELRKELKDARSEYYRLLYVIKG